MICSIERQGWARKIVHGCASWVGVRVESGLVDGYRLVVFSSREDMTECKKRVMRSNSMTDDGVFCVSLARVGQVCLHDRQG